MTPTLAVCCAAVLAAAIAAIVEAGGSSAPAGVYGDRSMVTIQNFTFDRALVSPGADVRVHNLDSSAHTVTSDADGVFDSGAVNARSDGSFAAPTEPGEYAFHCNIHTSMHGALVVASA